MNESDFKTLSVHHVYESDDVPTVYVGISWDGISYLVHLMWAEDPEDHPEETSALVVEYDEEELNAMNVGDYMVSCQHLWVVRFDDSGKVIDCRETTVNEFETWLDYLSNKYLHREPEEGYCDVCRRVHVLGGLCYCPKCKKRKVVFTDGGFSGDIMDRHGNCMAVDLSEVRCKACGFLLYW